MDRETMRLFDMHCHLDFAPHARKAADELAACGGGAFAVTVMPAGYERAAALLRDCPAVRVGVGLHPWWVADGRAGGEDVAAFERLAREARFVGEVGLDFGPKHAASREAQLAVFGRVAAACADGGKLLSLHAVKAADAVLDVLQGCGALAGNACVFHWFSGSSDELHRALRAGCFVSVNPRMLATKRGREYARIVPIDRLLLETDAPPEGGPYEVAAEQVVLRHLIEELAVLRNADPADLAERISQTSQTLLALS